MLFPTSDSVIWCDLSCKSLLVYMWLTIILVTLYFFLFIVCCTVYSCLGLYCKSSSLLTQNSGTL